MRGAIISAKGQHSGQHSGQQSRNQYPMFAGISNNYKGFSSSYTGGGCKPFCYCCSVQLTKINAIFPYVSPFPLIGPLNPSGISDELTVYSFYLNQNSNQDPLKEPPINSYVNIHILYPSFPLRSMSNPIGIYSGWCLDLLNQISLDTVYPETVVVSMLNPNAKQAIRDYSTCLDVIGEPILLTYFESILYIYNQAEIWQTSLGYTSDDIQTAIWTLLGELNPLTSPLKTFDGVSGGRNLAANSSNVKAIIAAAINAQNNYNRTKNACRYLLGNGIMGFLVLARQLPGVQGCVQMMSIMVDMTTLDLELCC